MVREESEQLVELEQYLFRQFNLLDYGFNEIFNLDIIRLITTHLKRLNKIGRWMTRKMMADALEVQGRLFGFQRRHRDGGGQVVIPGPIYYGPGFI